MLVDKDLLDEKKLREISKENLISFLNKNKETLVTFTREGGLRYIPLETLEKFVFNPSEGILYLPLASFLDRDLSNSEILWHIHYELALYPDWKENADL